MLELSSMERAYFDFLCEKMDSSNRILHKPELREDYINQIKHITGGRRTIGDRALLNYFKQFIKLGLILSSNLDTTSYLNPKYVFKGSEDARKSLLKNFLHRSNKGEMEIAKLLHKPLSSL